MDENNKTEEKEKELAATNKLLNIIRGEDKKEKEYLLSDKPNKSEVLQKDYSLQDNIKNDNYLKSENRSTETIPDMLLIKKRLNYKQERIWPFRNLLKNKEKRALGIDIGSHSLKLMLLEKAFNNLRIIDYKLVELPFEQINDDAETTAKYLKMMIKGINLEDTKIISSISGPSVIVRHVQFPPMNENELAQSLNWEAKSYIPFPLNEINLDYQILPAKTKNERLDVILVAVTKKALKAHLEIFERVSIKPTIVDIDPLVLINTYLLSKEENDDNKTMALINVGAQSTILSIYRPGSLLFTRDIRIGGNSFTKQIQSQFKVSFEKAETIKKTPANFDKLDTNENSVINAITPLLNELVSEIRRSLIYYDNQTGKKGFGDIILTGGGSLLNKISEKFSADLGLSIKFLEPFRRLHLGEENYPTLLSRDQSERLALCVGLALRGLL